jgi:hypothetical protein
MHDALQLPFAWQSYTGLVEAAAVALTSAANPLACSSSTANDSSSSSSIALGCVLRATLAATALYAVMTAAVYVLNKKQRFAHMVARHEVTTTNTWPAWMAAAHSSTAKNE